MDFSEFILSNIQHALRIPPFDCGRHLPTNSSVTDLSDDEFVHTYKQKVSKLLFQNDEEEHSSQNWTNTQAANSKGI